MAPDLHTLVENFGFLPDWEERYRYLIELGKKLPPMDDKDRTEANRVQGCMSQVWLVAKPLDTDPVKYEFTIDSDAHIVKGLAAILLAAFSGKTQAEIADVNIDQVFENLGFKEHISPNRRNGFFAMVERFRALAKQSR